MFFSSIKWKLFIGFFVLTLGPIILVGYYTFTTFSQSLLETNLRLAQTDVKEHVFGVESVSFRLHLDLIVLAKTPHIQGIIRARQNKGFDEDGNLTYQQWTDRLNQIFFELAQARDQYTQIRYINEDGYEVVRVDNIEGQATVILKESLQFKGDRDYFREAMKLEKGETYLSKLELNKEGSPPQIEFPIKPTQRMAHPVFDEAGNKRGIVVVNMLADNFFKQVEENHDDVEIRSYLVDQKGYYLFNEDFSKMFGGPNDLNTGERFQNDFVNSQDVLMERKKIIKTDDGYLINAPVYFDTSDKNRKWFLIQAVPEKVFLGPVTVLKRVFITASLAAVVVSIIFILLMLRLIMSPIKNLNIQIEKYGKGNYKARAKIKSRDEVGMLAQGFNQMANKINEYQSDLEIQVKSRTRELKKTQKKLEKQVENLEKFKKITVGREIKMRELKKQIKGLKKS